MAALYAKIEAPDTLALWSLSETVPAPRSLGEWNTVALAPAAVPIELLVEQRHARELVSGDDFVSACCHRRPRRRSSGRSLAAAVLRSRRQEPVDRHGAPSHHVTFCNAAEVWILQPRDL